MREIVGTWRKLTPGPGVSRYPSTLTFMPNGHYRGSAESPGEFTFWDVGTWTEEGPDEVTLSTANDAHITYRVSLDGDELVFVSPEGETIAYAPED
jgi:hypothetical protein